MMVFIIEELVFVKVAFNVFLIVQGTVVVNSRFLKLKYIMIVSSVSNWSIDRHSYVGMAQIHAQSQKPPNSEGLQL